MKVTANIPGQYDLPLLFDYIDGEEAIAGSRLPFSTGLFNDVEEDYNVTIETEKYLDPTFMPYFSSLDLNSSGQSAFCATIETDRPNEYHDVLPDDIPDKLMTYLGASKLKRIDQGKRYNFSKEIHPVILNNLVVGGELYFNLPFNGGFVAGTGNLNPSKITCTTGCKVGNIDLLAGSKTLVGWTPTNAKADLNIKSGTINIASGAELTIVNGSTVTIDEGAKLIANENFNLTVGPGSTLDIQGEFVWNSQTTPLTIKGGGTVIIANSQSLNFSAVKQLIIRDNSTLILGNSAPLTYPAGTVINLTGENSVLELGGKLNLGAGAQFSFSSDPNSRAGYVRLNEKIEDFIVAGTGSSFRLEGADKSDRILELVNNAYFGGVALGGPLVSLTLWNGEVQLNGSRLSVDKRFSLRNAAIKNGGLTVFGQTGVSIVGNDFTRVDLYGDLMRYGNSLRINNCSFTYGSIEIWDEPAYLFGVTTDKCPILISTTSFSSSISSLKASNENQSTFGAFYNFLSTGNILISNSKFDKNAYSITNESPDAGLYIGCTSITNGTDGIVDYGGNIYMNGNLFSGTNYIANGATSNFNVQRTNLYLSNGFNRFIPKHQNDFAHISGFLNKSCDNGNFIANSNQRFANNPFQRPNNEAFHKVRYSCGGDINLGKIVDNSSLPYAGCASPSSILDPNLCVTCPALNTQNFRGQSTANAIKIVEGFLSTSDQKRNDEKVISLIKEILTYSDILKASTEDQRMQLFDIAKVAYGNIKLYDEQSIPSSSTNKEFTTIMNLVTPKLVTDDNYSFAARLEITKYSYLRSLKLYDQAERILSNLECGVSNLHKRSIGNYRSQMNLEQELQTNNYSMSVISSKTEALRTAMLSQPRLSTIVEPVLYFVPLKFANPSAVEAVKCQNKLAQEQTGIDNVIVSEIRIYPNPTSGQLNIEDNDGLVKVIHVVDLLGKVVYSMKSESVTGNLTIDIAGLPSGIYQVECLNIESTIVAREKVVKN